MAESCTQIRSAAVRFSTRCWPFARVPWMEISNFEEGGSGESRRSCSRVGRSKTKSRSISPGPERLLSTSPDEVWWLSESQYWIGASSSVPGVLHGSFQAVGEGFQRESGFGLPDQAGDAAQQADLAIEIGAQVWAFGKLDICAAGPGLPARECWILVVAGLEQVGPLRDPISIAVVILPGTRFAGGAAADGRRV